STESFDRGQKFSDYQTLDRLEEYVLISSQLRRIEIFRRHTDGLWIYQNYDDRETFQLKSIGYTGTFTSLYEDV
ncbi:MAG: Uma2 family endonuclease, partial [Coleofasciculaceae cyanobacterium RL_1_1]|nr:Uma2 family endonuclease [Coleofasciculaceae cyanobacterium RL_1_1]